MFQYRIEALKTIPVPEIAFRASPYMYLELVQSSLKLVSYFEKTTNHHCLPEKPSIRVCMGHGKPGKSWNFKM